MISVVTHTHTRLTNLSQRRECDVERAMIRTIAMVLRAIDLRSLISSLSVSIATIITVIDVDFNTRWSVTDLRLVQLSPRAKRPRN